MKRNERSQGETARAEGHVADSAAERLGREVKQVARLVTGEVIAPSAVVKQTTTILFLNSLVSAYHSHRRIYLNAFQRPAEVLDYFGHRLQRRGFDVNSLQPQAINRTLKPLDVMITLSSSLKTEPVLVSLLHADLEGLYRFVITSRSVEETSRKFHGVLPVHIPGSRPEDASPELKRILPLGSLFELRSFVYLEAVAELLAEIMEEGERQASSSERRPDGPDPEMLFTFKLVRDSAQQVPAVMNAMAERYLADLERISDVELGRLCLAITETFERQRTVYVTGFGRNNAVGGMLAHRLAALRGSVAMTPSRIERPGRRDDFLIALTASGSTFEVLQRMTGAKRGGLRTAVVTAATQSPATRFADAVLCIPSLIEPRVSPLFVKRLIKPGDATRPSQSTFNFNALFTLEAIASVVMSELGVKESELQHTDPWQGFES